MAERTSHFSFMVFFVKATRRFVCRNKMREACSRKEEESDVFRRGVHARGSIALFSVALLWCSSLSSCGALVDLVLPAPISWTSVRKLLNSTLVATRRAEEEHAACATRQGDACMRWLQEGRRVELSRASYKESRNNNTVEVSQATARRCAEIERIIVTTLRRKDTDQISWKVSCSDEDRTEVRARIGLPRMLSSPFPRRIDGTASRGSTGPLASLSRGRHTTLSLCITELPFWALSRWTSI